MYVQSGLAWLHNGNQEWSDKRRGLDPCRAGHAPELCVCPGVFSLHACRNYLKTLHAAPDNRSPWQSYVGETTRFLGLGMALASRHPTKSRHCVWETATREISPGLQGKRVHVAPACRACIAGMSAYDGAHDLVINTRAGGEPYSYPHDIPWEDDSDHALVGHAQWRDYQDSLDEVEP